ncbi:MAG: hypothetical protein M0T84_15925 [Betaproteobacteria bacterium]|nr:hypothetical protein [Betaproteobacteria bacterium]
MYIESVPNRNAPPAVLLRESVREGKKLIERTLAKLSADVIEGLRWKSSPGTRPIQPP